MFHESITILTINPGTKNLGIAVLEAEDLIFWGVKVLKGKWSPAKMRSVERILDQLIEQYRVTVLVVKQVHPSRSSRHLNSLIGAIEKLARNRKLRIKHYTLEDVKESSGLGAKANKMELAEWIVGRYRFLAKDLDREKKHKHSYFVRMFEAIAAGILAFNRLINVKK